MDENIEQLGCALVDKYAKSIDRPYPQLEALIEQLEALPPTSTPSIDSCNTGMGLEALLSAIPKDPDFDKINDQIMQLPLLGPRTKANKELIAINQLALVKFGIAHNLSKVFGSTHYVIWTTLWGDTPKMLLRSNKACMLNDMDDEELTTFLIKNGRSTSEVERMVKDRRLYTPCTALQFASHSKKWRALCGLRQE